MLQDRFDQGKQVTELARTLFPDGILIDSPRLEIDTRLESTKLSLDFGAPVIFEASVLADDVFVAVDILQRDGDGFTLIEVKSSSSQKDEHIPDAAIQAHILHKCGIDVRRAEIMHLNKEYRFPDKGDLFQRSDVTTPVDALLAGIPGAIDAQLDVLAGTLPDVPIGEHCFVPRECPFLKRCWPQDRNHIKKLYRVGPKTVGSYFRKEIHWISDIPADHKLPAPAKRQLEAMAANRLVVEPGLAEALKPFDCKMGFLDFETIMRAVPVWPGMKPWQQAAAQFSYHEDNGDGTYSHSGHLAEGPHDARPILAEAMVGATANAERVAMYTSFEKTRVRELQKAVPDLAPQLEELEHKLIDLHPVVQNYVYHPAFEGSFSLKYILNPLVPELTYDDLIIVDGLVASVEIARLLFVAGKIPPEQRDKTRRDLLDYCERDTWAMVRLLERLRELRELSE